MALVTLQLSSLEEVTSPTPVQDDEKARRKRMQRRQSFVMVKGAALLLQHEEEPEEMKEPSQTSGPSEQQLHLQAMLRLLRDEDTLQLAVRLEPVRSCLTRYLLVVSSMGRAKEEQTILLGVDFPHDGSDSCTIGTVLPVWSNTQVFIDGDGGFSVTCGMNVRAFKPISVQTMWSLLQKLHKACEASESNSYILGSNLHTGLVYYQDHNRSPQGCVSAWTITSDITSIWRDPTTPEREETEKIIRRKLRDILRESDLENITSKQVRSALELHTHCALQDFTEFIDNEMIMILAQMDRPSEIFPYLYLGSEWNASNLEELQKNKVTHILNVTREIDNFFPETFTYLNIRVLDEESTNLLQYWKETHHFISSAKRQGSHVFVHCKMGVSRSASTVIAYAMKEYEWKLEEALKHVKDRRNIVQPNAGFLRQLQTYQGILGASKQRHNYLWKPNAEAPILRMPFPLDPLFDSTTLPPTSTKRKMNLRALMRSISEMDTTDAVPESQERRGQEQSLPGKLDIVSEGQQGVPEQVHIVSEGQQSVPEQVDIVSKGQQDVPEKVDTVSEGQQSLPEQVDIVSEGQQSVPEEVDIVSEGQQDVPEKVNTVSEGQQDVPEHLDTVSEGQQSVSEQVDIVSEGQQSVPEEVDIVSEGQQDVSEQVDIVSEGQQDVPEKVDIVSEWQQSVSEQLDSVSSMDDSLFDSQESYMDQEESVRKYPDTDVQKLGETLTDVNTNHDESTSVDEVFKSSSPTSAPRTPSSSARRRSRRRKKLVSQQSVEFLQGGCVMRTQSVFELEGAAIVSKRLQEVDQLSRRARITRQSNVGERPEKS
ncbi:protein phosphatase Slingshot homolog 3 [Mixophyes fleayi]|uniref:protein phosphatase Slingshot homolog 3 n=1 Tax=Mixophyes fleayi TaxID=3061075 RepID=UPI003F4DC589